MDNLTHSLVGALLGRMGLRRLTGRAMPTLIVAANAPDVDTFVAPLIGEHSQSFHRGFTHGIGGWVVMPFVVTALVLAWDRWRPSEQKVRPGWLLGLALIGTISHPAMDFLNTYGVRVLEPLSDRWFYGDTLFIVDGWLWIMLIAGFELSRWREWAGRRDWHVPAIAMFGVIASYIAANAAFSHYAEDRTAAELRSRRLEPTMVVASPPPLAFWQRRMLWRTREVHGGADFDLFDGLRLDGGPPRPNRLDDPRLAATLRRSADARAFYFWSRMPLVIIEEGRPWLADQRFVDRRRRIGRRTFLIPLDGRD